MCVPVIESGCASFETKETRDPTQTSLEAVSFTVFRRRGGAGGDFNVCVAACVRALLGHTLTSRTADERQDSVLAFFVRFSRVL